MTVHDLHDALNLLPADLIAAADRQRTARKTAVIPWKRWVSLAACLVLMLSAALMFRETILPGMGGKSEAAPEAPAAAAPMAPENGIITEVPAEEAQLEAPAADAAGSSSMQAAAEPEEELCIDHSHRFAEAAEEDRNAVGYCGNMQTTVYLKGTAFTFAGSDSVTMTDILIHLDYDPEALCRCMTEFTVDTEMITGIEVNLTEGFARCEKGQAALTEKQAAILQEIIDSLA